MDGVGEELRPYFTEHVEVCQNHRIYVERFGRQGGVPILFLHGGPGAGCSSRDKEFFDPTRHDVLFIDQRGAGRSSAPDILVSNNTTKLIIDIEFLLNRYKIGKINILGGSWGATLAILFAVHYPERVLKLILRGVFIADSEAIKYTLENGRKVRPTVYERFYSLTPLADWSSVARHYLSGMREGSTEARKYFIEEWARFELSVGSLSYSASVIDSIVSSSSFEQFSMIGAHYFANNFFLEPGVIFASTSRLADIPISVVHGKSDLVTSIEQVRRLVGELRRATLYETSEGHSAFEPATFDWIRSELATLIV